MDSVMLVRLNPLGLGAAQVGLAAKKSLNLGGFVFVLLFFFNLYFKEYVLCVHIIYNMFT